jgi:hypothetical protein
MTVKEAFSKFVQKPITIPVVLFLLVLLAYGLLIPWMGFYWDDLPFAWFLRFFGPTEFIEAFRPFRPLLGPIFTITTTLFGGHPLTWQIIGLVVRFLLGLGVWHLLRLVFPTRQQSALWVVLLFTVYPAYGQQWVALTHVNQELIPLLFLLSSFILSALALRNGHNVKRLTVFAVILQALGLFSTEYFFGLEILRFFFLLVILSETIPNRKDLLQKAGWRWLPYFIVWVLNAIWTYTYHQSTSYDSYDVSILSSSTLSPLALGNEFITTLSLSGFTSWLGTFNIFSIIDGSATQAIAFVIFLVTGAAVFLVMQARKDSHSAQGSPFGWWAVTIGLAGIFAGRLPSWAAGLPLKIEFDYDRFFVSIMLGASLFIVGLADLTLREGRTKVILLSILIGMSTAYQFSVANTFRRDWANQQDFFHQLAWRMPALKEDTALLTYELPLKYVSDMQLTASLNWLYAPDLENRDLPYVLLYLKTRFSPSELRADQPIQIKYRTVDFNGSTSNSVVIYKEAGGCLRVLDPVYGTAETVPGGSFYLIEAIPLSNPSLILMDAPQPEMDETFFGKEPPHDWCYFYAHAELARQQGDWESITKLYREAQTSGFSAAMPVENLPFIEAFAVTGDMDTAVNLTERTIKGQPTLCPALTTLWERVSQNVGQLDASVQLLQKECKP